MATKTFNGSFRADIMEAVRTSLVKCFVIFWSLVFHNIGWTLFWHNLIYVNLRYSFFLFIYFLK